MLTVIAEFFDRWPIKATSPWSVAAGLQLWRWAAQMTMEELISDYLITEGVACLCLLAGGGTEHQSSRVAIS